MNRIKEILELVLAEAEDRMAEDGGATLYFHVNQVWLAATRGVAGMMTALYEKQRR